MSLVLATGGLGFIGSHTCINLINKGYDVLIVDSLINSHEDIYLKILKEADEFKTYVNASFINASNTFGSRSCPGIDDTWREVYNLKTYLKL